MRSLAHRTDLFIAGLEGVLVDRGAYIAVHTPSNPTYWWGNCIIYKRAPRAEDAQPWLETFHREHPSAAHVAIGYDSAEPGEVSGFGIEHVTSDVMTATRVNPPAHPNLEAELRTLVSDADWNARLALSQAVHPWGRAYLERSNIARRRHAQAGYAAWFGAFLDGRLVSSLGVYSVGDGLARFQSVETHPQFERRGLCGTLVHVAATHAFEQMGAKTLVMVADPAYHAKRVYERVGFNTAEQQFTLERGDSD
jgi:RimJ/RimL family protein N-acetyltransferase